MKLSGSSLTTVVIGVLLAALGAWIATDRLILGLAFVALGVAMVVIAVTRRRRRPPNQ
jgi:uncharacterized membrane protein